MYIEIYVRRGAGALMMGDILLLFSANVLLIGAWLAMATTPLCFVLKALIFLPQYLVIQKAEKMIEQILEWRLIWSL